MAYEIVRANNAQITIRRPDGSTVEYSGPAEELTVVLAQLEKGKPLMTMAQLYRWAAVFNRLQPLLFGILTLCVAAAMVSWLLTPAPEYKPQSRGVSHEYSA